MNDDIGKLVSLITDKGNRYHRVISIYGMGGLGKTTLARKIYNHIEVERAFKQFAWVSITRQYNTVTVFRDILKQLVPKQMKESVDRLDDRELERELYKVQKETKCLVVLDDLWEIEDWKRLKPAFPFAEANSKILITTRNQKLAEVEFPYPLSLLSDGEGWELLRKRAFARRNNADSENDSQLETVGRKIVCKCGNLPLAISAIGGVLSLETSFQVWETVSKDVDSYLRRSEGSSKEVYGPVLQVLALSYAYLPYHLKPCFLYLGQFREGEDIDAGMLYRMWIAEGMVSLDHRGNEETLTDVAEGYLYEMAGRSMLQVKLDEFATARKVKSCYLHDLMRDFCLACGKEVEFLKLLDFRGGKDPLSDYSTKHHDDSPPRCSIHMEDTKKHGLGDFDSTMSMALEANGQLRSLTLGGGFRDQLVRISFPQEIFDSNKFKYLKVLKFEGCDFTDKRLPEGIKKLVNLRFLSFKDSDLHYLPPSVGQLKTLQTLDIRVRVNLTIVVPDVLCNLKQLKHLYLPGHRVAPGEGLLSFLGLSELETLVGFDNSVGNLKHLLGLNNLRFLDATLDFSENKNKNDLSPTLNYLNSNQHKLREAQLSISYPSGGPLADEDNAFPLDFLSCHCLHVLTLTSARRVFQNVQPPPIHSYLNELSLVGCSLEGHQMSFLGNLSSLRRLVLFLVDLVDRMMIIDANAFPKLISLEIFFMKNLEKWVVAEGSLPNLSYLGISKCEALEMIPDGLRFITTIKKLEIYMHREFIVQRIQGVDKQGGPDYDKISHVPVRKINYY